MSDDHDGDLAVEVDRLRRDLANSEAARADERAAARAEQARLTFELGHRVKNTLSVVQALASQTLRGSAPREEALDALSGRILALSRANDHILDLGWTTATLEAVARRVLDSPELSAGRITIEGPEVGVTAGAALAFAMALHELLTNARRHGALHGPGGKVVLSWRVEATDDGARGLTLAWTEQGGPSVEPPEKRGFGLRLVEQSLRTAFGRGVTLAFEPAGLVCRVTARLPAIPSHDGWA